jgi:chromosome segregation ATPase
MLGFLLALNPLADAYESSLIAEHLVMEGKNYYASGDYARAIHELSKALLIDPHNAEAQYYLNQLGAAAGVLLGRGSSSMSQMAHMSRNLEWYKTELSKKERDNIEKARLAQTLQAEREKLHQKLVNREQENKVLQQKIGDVQAHFRKKASQDRAMINGLEKISSQKDVEIACLNDELCTLEETLLTKVELVEEQENEIKDLSRNVQEVKKMSQQRAAEDQVLIKSIEAASEHKSKEIAKLSTDLVETKDQLATSNQTLTEKDQKMNELIDEINSLEKDLNTTEKRWESTKLDYEKTIQNLEQEVTQNKTQLSKTDEQYSQKMKNLQSTLREKRNELKAKENRLIAANYKLEVTQKALEAKNEVIGQLRKSLLALEQELVHVQARNQNEVFAKKAGQNVSKGDQERIDFIRKQDKSILDLKQKLADARQEIREIEKSTGQSDVKKLLDLKEQLTIVKLQLQDQGAQTSQNREQYDLLKSRLADTEKRLEVLVQISQDKDIQVKEIEKQLSEVLTQVNY